MLQRHLLTVPLCLCTLYWIDLILFEPTAREAVGYKEELAKITKALDHPEVSNTTSYLESKMLKNYAKY